MHINKIILLLALIFTTTINAIAENEPAINVEHDTYVKEYIDICDYYIKALTDMRNDVSVIQNMFEKKDKLEKKQLKLLKQKKYDEAKYDKLNIEIAKIDESINKYNDGFEGIALSYLTNMSELDKIDDDKMIKQLKRTIDKAIDTITSYKQCYSHGDNKSSVCSFDYSDLCSNYGYDNFGLYIKSTSDLVNINKVYVDMNDGQPRIKKILKLICYMKGSRTNKYEQTKLLVNYKSPYLIYKDGNRNIYDDEIFNNLCIDNNWMNEHNNNIELLKQNYPTIDNKQYVYNVQGITEKCISWATSKCSNTYVIRNKVILSYPTVGCQIRDVTKEDVENDIKYYESNADKLNQSVLIDIIDFCQNATNNNYSWFYNKPVLSKACLNKNNKTKPKNK